MYAFMYTVYVAMTLLYVLFLMQPDDEGFVYVLSFRRTVASVVILYASK